MAGLVPATHVRLAVRKQISDIRAQPKASTLEELTRHIESPSGRVCAGKGRYPAALASFGGTTALATGAVAMLCTFQPPLRGVKFQ
jgi:hypothetical protein